MRRAIKSGIILVSLLGLMGGTASAIPTPPPREVDHARDRALTLSADITPVDISPVALKECRGDNQYAYFPYVSEFSPGGGLLGPSWAYFHVYVEVCRQSGVISVTGYADGDPGGPDVIYKHDHPVDGPRQDGASCGLFQSRGHFNDGPTDSVEIWSPTVKARACV